MSEADSDNIPSYNFSNTFIKLKSQKIGWVLALLSGVCFGLAWKPLEIHFLPFLTCVAFLPIFFLCEKYVFELAASKKNSYSQPKLNSPVKYVFISFLVWNVIATGWILHAHVVAGLFILVVQSGIQTLVIQLWMRLHAVFSHYKMPLLWYVFFVFLWLSFEYIMLNNPFHWPWLILGNSLGSVPKYIQWYEFTGHLGGSLWILFLNVFFYHLIKLKNSIFWIILIVINILWPLAFVNQPTSRSISTHPIRLIQSNQIPSLENRSYNQDKQIAKLIQSANEVDSQTCIIAPETFLWDPVYVIDDTIIDRDLKKLYKEAQKRNISFILGARTFKIDSVDNYEFFNSLLLINSTGIQQHNKSKLVPVVEYNPFGQTSLKSVFEVFYSGTSYLPQDSLKVLQANWPFVPAICYESAFSGYISKASTGASVLVLITNDGWWGDSDFLKQHLYLAAIRAIENRLPILRSSTTGITCVMNRAGEVVEKLPTTYKSSKQEILWLDAMVSMKETNRKPTFFAVHGNYLAKFAVILTLIPFLVWVWIKLFQKKTRKQI